MDTDDIPGVVLVSHYFDVDREHAPGDPEPYAYHDPAKVLDAPRGWLERRCTAIHAEAVEALAPDVDVTETVGDLLHRDGLMGLMPCPQCFDPDYDGRSHMTEAEWRDLTA